MENSTTKNILILGGSNEGFLLAEQLNDDIRFNCVSSLAGRTSLPKKPVGEYRTGGFGGPDGLANYLKTENIHALIDATHPFAINISKNASLAATIANCPLIQIIRPAWQKTEQDNWLEVSSMEQAANILTAAHSPVFLTIGRLELAAFRNRTDLQMIARAIEPAKKNDPDKSKLAGLNSEPESWPLNISFIYAKGPFNYNAEKELIQKHNIKSIVSKNSGGEKAKAKLDIARDLKIPVIMINRQQQQTQQHTQTVSSVKEAIIWLEEIYDHK